jgi:hypothetical protein
MEGVMTDRRYRSSRRAAMRLLRRHSGKLTQKQAKFLGQFCTLPELTPKQRGWLDGLLRKNDGSRLADRLG